MILVDTSILSRLFRGRKPGPAELALRQAVDALLASDTPLALPAIVLQEALTGIRGEKQFADLGRLLLSAPLRLHQLASQAGVSEGQQEVLQG